MRVEIKGQFNIDWVGSSFNSEKVEVSRDGTQTMSLPRNFDSFCSEANIKLMKVQKAKKFQHTKSPRPLRRFTNTLVIP